MKTGLRLGQRSRLSKREAMKQAFAKAGGVYSLTLLPVDQRCGQIVIRKALSEPQTLAFGLVRQLLSALRSSSMV